MRERTSYGAASPAAMRPPGYFTNRNGGPTATMGRRSGRRRTRLHARLRYGRELEALRCGHESRDLRRDARSLEQALRPSPQARVGVAEGRAEGRRERHREEVPDVGDAEGVAEERPLGEPALEAVVVPRDAGPHALDPRRVALRRLVEHFRDQLEDERKEDLVRGRFELSAARALDDVRRVE